WKRERQEALPLDGRKERRSCAALRSDPEHACRIRPASPRKLPSGEAKNEGETVVLCGLAPRRGERQPGPPSPQVSPVARDHVDQIVHVSEALGERPRASISVVPLAH